MHRLPISAAKRDYLFQTLRNSHRMRVQIHVKNSDEDTIKSLTAPADKIVSGQITVDAHAEVTRTLELTLLDPNQRLKFEHKNPAQGATFINRLIAIEYEVWLPQYQEWQGIPCFWGPITGYSRDGPEVSIEAAGKESMLMDPERVGHGFTLDKGLSIHAAIRKVGQRMGERRFKIAHTPGQRLKRPYTVHANAEPWQVITGGKKVQGVRVKEKDHSGNKGHGHHGHHHGKGDDAKFKMAPAGGLVRKIKGHYHAFYNGKGELVVRKVTKHPVLHMKYGRDLVSRPTINYDASGFRNTVKVIGKKAKKSKAKWPPMAKVSLDSRLQGSPHNLARNNVPRELITVVHVDTLQTDAECREHAKTMLKHLSKEQIEAQYECLPFPMLEELDWILLETPDYKFKFVLRNFVIPLTSADPMSINRKKRIRPHKRKHTQIPGRGHHGHTRHRHPGNDGHGDKHPGRKYRHSKHYRRHHGEHRVKRKRKGRH